MVASTDTLNNNATFQQQVLKSHNQLRSRHNTQKVTWSNDLAKQAQDWANTIAKRGKFEHSPPAKRQGQGENIACAGGKELTGEMAIKMWYDEIKDFNFSKIKHNPKCGHFTQVIWAESVEIGAGRAKASNGMEFVVCRYSPAGNMLSDFQDNIKPPVNDDVIPTNGEQQGEDLIIPNKSALNHCEPDDAAIAENIKDEDAYPLVETKPLYRKDYVTYQGTPLVYEMKEFVDDSNDDAEARDKKPICKTVQVTQCEEACKKPYYKSRDYLQQGVPYNIILHHYK